MHKVKTRNRLDLIDCWGVQPAVALHLYKGGGLDPLPTDFRVNPAVLGNRSREKLGTLTVSAQARTVRAATADCPDRGPSGLRAGPSAGSKAGSTYAPLPFGGAEQTKSN